LKYLALISLCDSANIGILADTYSLMRFCSLDAIGSAILRGFLTSLRTSGDMMDEGLEVVFGHVIFVCRISKLATCVMYRSSAIQFRNLPLLHCSKTSG
jgi:hypothetical protein